MTNPTQAAPPGYVESEPTDAMIAVGMPWLINWKHMRKGDQRRALASAYKDMAALAAPTVTSLPNAGRSAALVRGIAEIMAGLVSGEISGDDIVWASQVETLWERCHALLAPDGVDLPQTADVVELLAAVAAASPAPPGQPASQHKAANLIPDVGKLVDKAMDALGTEGLVDPDWVDARPCAERIVKAFLTLIKQEGV